MIFNFNKPVFVLGQGPSIEELESWIGKFKDLDVYWVSYCAFHTVEPIISSVGKHFNILYLHCLSRLEENEKQVYEYLQLGEDRFVIANHKERFEEKFPFLLKKNKTEVIFTNSVADGGSLPRLLEDFLILGFRRICLFGCDGKASFKGDHYKQYLYDEKKEAVECPPAMRKFDLMKINLFGHSYFDKYHAEILNCNLNTHIHCFKKIGYNQVLDIYGGQK